MQNCQAGLRRNRFFRRRSGAGRFLSAIFFGKNPGVQEAFGIHDEKESRSFFMVQENATVKKY